MPIINNNQLRLIIFIAVAIIVGNVIVELEKRSKMVYLFLRGDRFTEKSAIKVRIKGAVQKPGDYCLMKGSRLSELVKAAGGYTRNSAGISVNNKLIDGMEYSISYMKLREREMLNLNTVKEIDLKRIPFLNDDMISGIISYREKYGRFDAVDELIEIKGIGNKMLNLYRNYFYVGEKNE